MLHVTNEQWQELLDQLAELKAELGTMGLATAAGLQGLDTLYENLRSCVEAINASSTRHEQKINQHGNVMEAFEERLARLELTVGQYGRG